MCELASSGSGQGPVEGSYDHDNESLGSIKHGEFHNQMNEYLFLKDCALCGQLQIIMKLLTDGNYATMNKILWSLICVITRLVETDLRKLDKSHTLLTTLHKLCKTKLHLTMN
jgi:hypothetical protein